MRGDQTVGKHSAKEHEVYAVCGKGTLSLPLPPEEYYPYRAGRGIPIPEEVMAEGEDARHGWALGQIMLAGWHPTGGWLDSRRIALRPMSVLEREMTEHIARMQKAITRVGDMAENMAHYADECGFSRDMANIHAVAVLEALGEEYQAPRPEETSRG